VNLHGLMVKQVCYVAFWDEVTLSTQEAEGKMIGENGMIGRWHIIVVKGLPFVDQRLNGKIPKVMMHRWHDVSFELFCGSDILKFMDYQFDLTAISCYCDTFSFSNRGA
jgi:hypothetical protein